MVKKFAFSNKIKGEELRAFRKRYSLSVMDLAGVSGLSNRTIERYEGENSEVSGTLAALIKVIDDNPEILDYYEILKKRLVNEPLGSSLTSYFFIL